MKEKISNWIIKYYLLIFFGLFLFSGSIAHADFSQTISSTQSDYNTVGATTYPYISQGFGTGLSGNIGMLTLYLNINATSSNQVSTTIIGCDDINCSGGANVFTNYPDITDDEFTGTKTLYTLNPTTETTFNPSYYYFLLVQPSGGFGNSGYSYRSSANSYPGGEADCTTTRCGSILDYYFTSSNQTTNSRFITLDPLAGETTATSTSVGAEIYINSDDFTEDMFLDIYFVSNSAIYIGNGGYVPDFIRFPITSPGLTSYSTTTTFLVAGGHEARYKVSTESALSSIPIIGVLFSPNTLMSTSSAFFVGYRTQADDVADTVGQVLDDLGGTSSTSCTNFTTDFVSDCVKFLFIPNPQALNTSLEALRNGVLASWPVGYVTRMVEIFTASTSASLPVFQATVPAGIPGTGSSITLDLNHSLDTVLNATTGVFTNSSASSTDTFYEFTKPYWDTIMYLLLAFYILRRILGSHIVPTFNKEGGIGNKPYGPKDPR